jgi:hypothetical protein
MSRKDFIRIADAITEHNKTDPMNNGGLFTYGQIGTLARVFQQINPRFDYSRWTDYIAGRVGPNGGAR